MIDLIAKLVWNEVSVNYLSKTVRALVTVSIKVFMRTRAIDITSDKKVSYSFFICSSLRR
jgi:hypothetical protein